MAKIHTHYDNLKVARMAPQEVIRAAYKALSQKYHPDKNPGDEKAARIMAIVNSAYLTLSDPQRRKEHDEWIAAEEWEVEWLESTRHEDVHGHAPVRHGHDKPDKQDKHAKRPDTPWEHGGDASVQPRRRGWRLWGGMAACLLLGWAGGVTMVAEPHLLSSMLASAWGGKGGLSEPPAAAPAPPPETRAAKADTPADGWAVSRAYYPDTVPVRAAPIKVLALSQVVLPGALPDCDSETQTLVAPNGEPWPAESGYVEGFPVANKGEDMQLTVDNAGNASAVFIKVYDMERHSNVRYAYVQAHDKLLLDKLASGRYEIRYQNIDLGANQTGCPRRQAKAGGAAPVR